jgi:RNA polymerase sigma-70 factor, ECF subfamily
MDAGDDCELVQRTRSGDLRAFEGLVARYEGALFNLALRMLGNVEDARDVTQMAFVKAYQHLDRFDGRGRFFSWIYRIAVNESLNARARRRPNVELDESLPWDGNAPDVEAGRGELRRVVQEVLMELDPPQRKLIVMRHLLHMSHADMSETLGIPEKTVKSRLFTARRAMATLLRRRGVAQS